MIKKKFLLTIDYNIKVVIASAKLWVFYLNIC